MLQENINSLWLVGVGKIGSALLGGWHKNPNISSITAIDRKVTDKQLAEAPRPDALFFAVKPQTAKENNCEIIKRYQGFLKSDTMVVSVMAGLPTALLRRELKLDEDASVIRAMPNTPCQIGEGITGLYAGPEVDEAQRQQIESLFAPTGETFWVTEEEQMHAVTALTGSGPGFTFAFMEELEHEGVGHQTVIDIMLDAAANGFDPAEATNAQPAFAFVRNFKQAAIEQGFDPVLAQRMAARTVTGSALLAQATGTDFAQLRQNVTSKDGTTDRGLRQFQENGAFVTAEAMSQRIGAAVNAATARSREMGALKA